MPRPKKIPTPHHHRASNQVRVRLNHRDFYCGPWDDPASHEKAHRLIAESLAGGAENAAHKAAESPDGISVTELILAYVEFAQGYYRKDGEETTEMGWIRDTVRVLREHYGRTPANEFRPLKLKALREAMIAKGWTRSAINSRIGRVKRMFKWGIENELVDPSVYHGLQAVAGLRMGRSNAQESDPVMPVDASDVNACLPFMTDVVAAMVKFQAATGCRPNETCIIRPCDIDREDPNVWTYSPSRHKTQHHGRERMIYIGPKGQRAIAPFLDNRPADAFCFSPRESEEERRAKREAERKTPKTYGNRRGSNRKPKPKWLPGERYDHASYRSAVHHAITAANKQREKDNLPPIPKWTPNQLRHAAATAIRREFGLEAAQVSLGHSAADVTQIYAERDETLARKVASEIG